ncbi:hypothetical protein CCP4SC76_2970007 [Gammaproteobacteria bacterium]
MIGWVLIIVSSRGRRRTARWFRQMLKAAPLALTIGILPRVENLSKYVRLSELRELSISFHGDLFVLAAWVLANDIEWSARQRGTVRRTTLHGLVGKYVTLTGEDPMKIRQCLIAAGISLEATLQPDEYQTPNQALHLTNV